MIDSKSRQVQALEVGTSSAVHDGFPVQARDPHLRLVVVHTTMKGTLSALKAAAALARDLNAPVGFSTAEVVPFPLRSTGLPWRSIFSSDAYAGWAGAPRP